MTVHFSVVVDENGDMGFGTTENEAAEHYEENIGGDAMRRMIGVQIEVPFVVPVLKGAVPAQGDAELTVA